MEMLEMLIHSEQFWMLVIAILGSALGLPRVAEWRRRTREAQKQRLQELARAVALDVYITYVRPIGKSLTGEQKGEAMNRALDKLWDLVEITGDAPRDPTTPELVAAIEQAVNALKREGAQATRAAKHAQPRDARQKKPKRSENEGKPRLSLADLSVDQHTRGILREAGIDSVEQLGMLTDSELREIDGIGKKRAATIQVALARHDRSSDQDKPSAGRSE